MTPRAILRDAAWTDMVEQAAWLRGRSATAAGRFRAAALEAIERLARCPLMGRAYVPGHAGLEGLRSWPVRGFEAILVFYRPVEGGIEVVRVLHGARDLPGELGAEA